MKIKLAWGILNVILFYHTQKRYGSTIKAESRHDAPDEESDFWPDEGLRFIKTVVQVLFLWRLMKFLNFYNLTSLNYLFFRLIFSRNKNNNKISLLTNVSFTIKKYSYTLFNVSQLNGQVFVEYIIVIVYYCVKNWSINQLCN